MHHPRLGCGCFDACRRPLPVIAITWPVIQPARYFINSVMILMAVVLYGAGHEDQFRDPL